MRNFSSHLMKFYIHHHGKGKQSIWPKKQEKQRLNEIKSTHKHETIINLETAISNNLEVTTYNNAHSLLYGMQVTYCLPKGKANIPCHLLLSRSQQYRIPYLSVKKERFQACIKDHSFKPMKNEN